MKNIRVIILSKSQIFINGLTSFLDRESGFITKFLSPEDLKDNDFTKKFDLAIINGSLVEVSNFVFFENQFGFFVNWQIKCFFYRINRITKN